MQPNEEFIREAERLIRNHSAGGQFYVLYTDITDFHTVNSVYGTEAGDALLQDMQGLLLQCPGVRICRRIFADMFLCLLFLDEGVEIEKRMAQDDIRIQDFLKQQRAKYPACGLKAACGLCLVGEGGVLQAIDDANVARKESKKQLAVKAMMFSEAMRIKTVARLEGEREIYEAIENNRFCFYLQPKVDLTTGSIIGAEALARRLDQDGKIVYPDQFLQIMETNGTITELDMTVCRQVCEHLADRLQKGLPVVCTSVNLSRLHIHNPNAARELHAITAQYKVPPELLEFELTETILLKEFEGAKRLINELRAYGHRVSIDDFGSGYAGMNIWQELSFDCLKLDRRFLSESGLLKKRNEALVPNIINIAQRLHVQVLCEGVETPDQCRYLLSLGCTAAQGFYFSIPVPAQEFYLILEKDEPYSLPTSWQPERTKEPEKTAAHKKLKGRTGLYFLVIVLCALFLGVCITVVLSVSRNVTQREFTRMVKETLNAYTAGQRENTLAEIEGVAETLQSMAVLIGKNEEPTFIDTYLLALNEESQEVKYMYFSAQDYEEQLAQGKLKEADQATVQRLKHGETVVTDITFSKRMGNVYCIGIGVPVFRDGQFIGAVRGIINAETLVSTEMYDPGQGEIAAVFLTDCQSSVLPIRQADGKAVGERLLDRLQDNGVEEEALRELESAFALDDLKARSIRLGVFDGSPYYLSLTGLKYNGWHLVVCLKADTAARHFQYIVRSTAYSIAGLIIAVVAASLVLIFLMRKMQRKFSMDEQRYLLLERFSDTVLFDYDCRRDTIRFTSNASRLLRIHEAEQKDFLRGQDRIYVYAGDQAEIRRMLGGELENQSGEIRVRLMRPDVEEYFWCMAQYQYLYEKNALVSVIGKITDIDEHMRHEDYLLRMSETDGLTGLVNKSAAEKQINERLKRADKGILFVMDADGFKQINDRYGHAAGDLALSRLGDCMRQTFRKGDILGRIGGDEMCVFAENMDNPGIAAYKAELLQKNLQSAAREETPSMTLSIGIACFPSDALTYRELFHAADQAMYAAKQRGKGQVCFYSDLKNQEVK